MRAFVEADVCGEQVMGTVGWNILYICLDEKDCFVVLIGIVAMFIVDVLHEKGKRIRKTVAAQPLPIRWICYYGMIFVIVILGVYGAGYDASAFVYGAF